METILVVDDTNINIKILVELLGDKYDIIVAIGGESAINIASSEQPDLILLDIMMPVMDGFEVCRRLKQNPKTNDIPIIFLTAKTDEDSIERAYEMGGSDYILKPFKPKELMARVKTHLKIQNLIKNLEYLSSYDTMTGILNRRKFFELAQNKFEKEKENLFAIMIDIDKFKGINDKFGHHVGDIVIKTITTCIEDILPKNSIFGRIGGEEFAIICNFENETNLFNYFEKIRNLIKEQSLNIENNTIKFTISIGIAQYNNTFLTIDDLLKRADKMLYKAKETGRDKTILRK
ncbi:response regulator receiver modulated diguanylate cyclase [Arcobacter nitrofigilis DSM 7299]|uniref:diguanylate cyclase n=1 Tax=Arcobacter nitrofigilis (strain ATCC 33309 / DSM 7299 / CCUG 15893 / LMG 7604 / NCTC 12251 / CI) TaxID=572480 RepID=D5V3Z1_ARCNC|nr:diguanylate cyclase [Arcobacter nitrofigilis]ADG92819.1 response regulator receiver modulated diguanylate cyclase [Arcobacter nitrofigilis DSM 7299]